MIKTLIINAGLMFFTFCGYSQINLDNLMTKKTLNCEDIAYNSTDLIIKYYNKQDFDSAKIVLNYWEKKCGISEPLIRTKILFAIKDKSFSEGIYDTTMVDYILNYMNRMEVIRPENTYNYYKFYFGFIPIKGDYDNFTQKIANELLSTQIENSLEQYYCEVYSNILKNPIDEIQNTIKYDNTKIKSYYLSEVNKYKNKPDFHASIITGIWIPTGNLKFVGNHPFIGFQSGFRYKKTTCNFDLTFRFIDSKRNYTFLNAGKLDTTNYYFGGYIGADIDREIYKTKKHQIVIAGGIGADIFSPMETDTKDNNPNNDKSRDIYSLNLNIGIGYKYFFSKNGYLGLLLKYNFVNYKNNGGTNLSDNCITTTLLFGGFTNYTKNYNLKILRYND